MTISRNRGVQPLDDLLNKLDLKNGDLVKCSKEHLTHKMITRGRKGRFLTRNVQLKIRNALNACRSNKMYRLKELLVKSERKDAG